MFALTLPAHAHVYILEKSQHKVPEEALKVSNTFNMGNKSLPLSAAFFLNHLFIPTHSHLLELIAVKVLGQVMAADLVFLGMV